MTKYRNTKIEAVIFNKWELILTNNYINIYLEMHLSSNIKNGAKNQF